MQLFIIVTIKLCIVSLISQAQDLRIYFFSLVSIQNSINCHFFFTSNVVAGCTILLLLLRIVHWVKLVLLFINWIEMMLAESCIIAHHLLLRISIETCKLVLLELKVLLILKIESILILKTILHLEIFLVLIEWRQGTCGTYSAKSILLTLQLFNLLL